MSGSRRATGSRRKQNNSSGRYAFAAVATGVLGIGVIAGAVFVLRGEGEEPASASSPIATSADAGAVETPKTGPVVSLTTPDGFRYKIAAVSGTRKSTGEAYADYTLTNVSGKRAPLETPGSLFVNLATAGEAGKRCAANRTVPAGLCGVQTITEVVGYLGTSQQPEIDGEDQWMPPGAGYLVRVSSSAKVGEIRPSDLRLYISEIRFVTAGKAIPIPFPR
ncbi:hypothetical protein [Actinocorallia longicatena]|uniref:Ribosomally synthesized peptide with SipW-like signal peptide n=1 Tax=Actinocorallia longicatena TaxID=111803 RepID=A0ABP6QK11_9ACTN